MKNIVFIQNFYFSLKYICMCIYTHIHINVFQSHESQIVMLVPSTAAETQNSSSDTTWHYSSIHILTVFLVFVKALWKARCLLWIPHTCNIQFVNKEKFSHQTCYQVWTEQSYGKKNTQCCLTHSRPLFFSIDILTVWRNKVVLD